MDNPKLYSTKEAAQIIGKNIKTLERWRKSGKLVPIKVDENGYCYYSEQQLQTFPKLVKTTDKTTDIQTTDISQTTDILEKSTDISIQTTDILDQTTDKVPTSTDKPPTFFQSTDIQTTDKVQTFFNKTTDILQTTDISSETTDIKYRHFDSQTTDIPEKTKTAHNKADTTINIDNSTYYTECQQQITHPACVIYLQGRGLPIDFCREYGIGFDVVNHLVVIPHTKSFCTRRYIGDNPNRPRFNYQKNSHLALFNEEAIANNSIVAVTESAFDALTLIYLGIPTVGLGGTANWNKFVDAVITQINIPIVLLALDNDEAGAKTSKEIENKLADYGIFSYPISICGNFKDPNERLQKDSDGIRKSIAHIISEHYREYLQSLKENFDIQLEAKREKDSQIMELFILPDTDDDNAKRILKLYDKDVRFLFDLDRWLLFKKPVWNIAPNTKNSVLYPLVRKLSDTMLEYSTNKDQLKQGKALQSRKKRSDAIEMIKGYDRIIITSKDLNNNPMLLNCPNGVVDLETGRLMQHDSSLLFTLCTGAKYHTGYRSEAINTFLKQIIPDEETLEALLLYLSYCLTASTREEKALFIHGGGGNGKGTLMKVFSKMLGTFATPFKIDTVLTGSYIKDGEAPTPELAKLEWKRVAIAEEIPAGRKLDIAKFKLLTGGDALPIRRLHSDATFIEDPTHKMIFSGNHLPELDDSRDPGLKRRLLVIEFKQNFIGDKCNTHLKEELLKPEAICGLLSLLIDDYCIKWQKYGLQVSEAMLLDRMEYLESNDVVGSFIEENCEHRADLSISRATFLKRIRLTSNIANMTDNAIISAVRKIEGLSYRRSGHSGSYSIFGIGWKDGERQEYLDSLTNE